MSGLLDTWTDWKARQSGKPPVSLVLGEPWPVDDRTPAPIREAEPEPEPVAESPAPDVEEESVWA